MKIIISSQAEKRLKKLPKIDQIAVVQKIRSFKREREKLIPEKTKFIII